MFENRRQFMGETNVLEVGVPSGTKEALDKSANLMAFTTLSGLRPSTNLTQGSE
jgi:hypothetical protein